VRRNLGGDLDRDPFLASEDGSDRLQQLLAQQPLQQIGAGARLESA
jgi:hypothetical protein